MRNMKPYGRLLGAFGTALLCAAGTMELRAQTSAAPGAAESQEEEIMELSPFVVNADQDTGYVAANTLSGARISTSLKETPAAISVLTREFLDDIMAEDIRDFGNWAPNADMLTYQDDNTRDREFVRMRIRGIAPITAASRNYFSSGVPSDSFSTERLEVARGPNAILFGDGPLSGIPTSQPKRAYFGKAITELKLSGDSWGSERFTLDLNRSYKQLFAGRLNVLRSNRAGWRDADFTKRDGVQGSATINLTRKTRFRLEGEWGEQERNGERFYYTDQSSNWDQKTIATSTNVGATGTGTGKVSTSNPYHLWNQNLPELGLLDWRGTAQTSGSGYLLLPPEFLISEYRPGKALFPSLSSRDFTLGAKASFNFFKYKTGSVFLEQSWGKLDMELAYNYEDSQAHWYRERLDQHYLDLNPKLPNGQDNPYFLQPFDDSGVQQQMSQRWYEQARVTLSYPLELKWMTQRMVLMLGTRDSNSDTKFYRLVRVNNPAEANLQATANLVYTRRYWKDSSNTPFSAPQSSNGVEVASRLTGNQGTIENFKYWQFASAGSYFKKRLNTIFGFRQDQYEQDSGVSFNTSNDWRVKGIKSTDYLPPLITDPKDATGKILPGLRDPDGKPSRIWASQRANVLDAARAYDPVKNPYYYEVYPIEETVNTMSAGFVCFLLPQVGLTYNQSSGFNIGTIEPNISYAPWSPPKNDGKDIGLRFDLFDSRLSGTISYYKSKTEGGTVRGQGSNIRDLWNNARIAYENSALAATASGNTGLAAQYDKLADEAENQYNLMPPNYNDWQETHAKGWEVDLVANVTKQWRIKANAGFPKTTTYGNLRDTKVYYAKYLPTWDAYLADTAGIPASSQRNTILSRYNSIKSSVDDAVDGRPGSGVWKYMANFFTTYSFDKGWVKGLTLGGGMQLRGKRSSNTKPSVYGTNPATGKVEFYTPEGADYLSQPGFNLVTLMTSYDFKVRGVRLKAQFNVSNALNEDKLIFNNWRTYTYTEAGVTKGIQIPDNFQYLDPRKIQFMLTARF